MSPYSKIAASLVLLGVATANAQAGNIVSGGQAKMKVLKSQLAIKSPKVNVCPTPASMTGWIFTNKEGPVEYMIARKGGSVSGPFTVQAKKGANGVHMASFSRTFDVHHAIDTEYRILIGSRYGGKLSNWAPLKASCKIKLGG